MQTLPATSKHANHLQQVRKGLRDILMHRELWRKTIPVALVSPSWALCRMKVWKRGSGEPTLQGLGPAVPMGTQRLGKA